MKHISHFTSLTLLVVVVLLLCSSVLEARTIDLQHVSIETTSNENLLSHLTNLKTTQNRARALTSETPHERLQLMITVSDQNALEKVERLLGNQFTQMIPPNTIVIHDDINTISQTLQQNSDLKDEIEWIGHVKPEHKTLLNFTRYQTQSTDAALVGSSHEEAIHLYVVLSTQTKDHTDLLVHNLNAQFNKKSRRVGEQIVKMVEVKQVSSSKLLVKVSPDVANEVLEHLKIQEEIHWIERKMPLAVSNHAGNEILQGNGKPPAAGASSTPLWDRGITGAGEIVGVADTGIDYDNCFFVDHDQPLSFDGNKPNFNHRKIVAYHLSQVTDPNDDRKVYKADRQDYAGGHGTHVSGSIAGNLNNNATQSYDELSKFNGVAKDAKLFLTDIYNPAYSGLLIPDNLDESFFVTPYEKGGVRIHSNSWGCSFAYFQCSYDCSCKWAQTTQYGKKGEVVSPEFCKESFGTDCCKVCNQYDSRAAEVDKFVSDNDDMLIVFAAGNIGHQAKSGTITSPSTAKNCLAVGASQTTTESFVKSVEYEDFSAIFSLLTSVGIPVSSPEACCAVRLANPDQTELVHRLCCPSKMRAAYTSGYFDRNNMAYFSSRGPTTDGRIKPDVVGPGYNVVSMHSDGDPTSNQCSTSRPNGGNTAALMTLQGTSMATPLVSGSAALVRQYYRKLGVNPSGPLLKATLVHSGEYLTGTISLNGGNLREQLPAQPNHNSGFGLVSLSNVLAFADSAFKLYFYDRRPVENNGQDSFCFVATKAGAKARATLVYYDPPASPSAKNLLVNDLDLDLFTYKNGSKSAIRSPGNGQEGGDTKNTVERADLIDIPEGNIVVVSVTGSRVKGTQKFSVVVTGDVQQLDGGCWIPPRPAGTRFLLYIIIGVCVALGLLLVIGAIAAVAVFKYQDRKHEGGPHVGGRRLGSGHVTLQDSEDELEDVETGANPSAPQYYVTGQTAQ